MLDWFDRFLLMHGSESVSLQSPSGFLFVKWKNVGTFFCTPGSLILTGVLQNFTKCPIRFQNWEFSSELFLEIFETTSVPSFWGTVMTSHVPWPHLKWIDHDKSSAFWATPVTPITAYQSQIIKRVFHFATLQQNQAEEAMTRQESLSVKSKALSHHMSQGRFSCKKGIL